MIQSHSFALMSLVALLATSGCGSSGPELAPVTGLVTLDGEPVRGAVISFISQAEKGSPSYGGTDENGRYELMFTNTAKGALPGEHLVNIETTRISKSEAKEIEASTGSAPPAYVPIPKKYKQQGALKATVNKGSNTIDFALSSK